jgi:hypothetical protein
LQLTEHFVFEISTIEPREWQLIPQLALQHLIVLTNSDEVRTATE